MPPPLDYYFFFTFIVFLVKADKFDPTILSDTRLENFRKASFFLFFITTHIVYLLFDYPEIYFLFTYNIQNILFVYLVTALLYFYITYVSC